MLPRKNRTLSLGYISGSTLGSENTRLPQQSGSDGFLGVKKRTISSLNVIFPVARSR